MAQSRLRQVLPSLTALRHSLSPSPLVKTSHLSSLPSQKQQDSCSFLTSLVQSRACTSYPTVSEIKIGECRLFKQGDHTGIEVSFESCDYNHWLICMAFGDPEPTQEEMIRTYEETCAKVLDISLEEAKQRIYFSDTIIFLGFRAKMTREESEKFIGAPGVVRVLRDIFLDPECQEYGGDPYINGTITPSPAEDWPTYSDRQEEFEDALNDLWAEHIEDMADRWAACNRRLFERFLRDEPFTGIDQIKN